MWRCQVVFIYLFYSLEIPSPWMTQETAAEAPRCHLFKGICELARSYRAVMVSASTQTTCTHLATVRGGAFVSIQLGRRVWAFIAPQSAHVCSALVVDEEDKAQLITTDISHHNRAGREQPARQIRVMLIGRLSIANVRMRFPTPPNQASITRAFLSHSPVARFTLCEPHLSGVALNY